MASCFGLGFCTNGGSGGVLVNLLVLCHAGFFQELSRDPQGSRCHSEVIIHGITVDSGTPLGEAPVVGVKEGWDRKDLGAMDDDITLHEILKDIRNEGSQEEADSFTIGQLIAVAATPCLIVEPQGGHRPGNGETSGEGDGLHEAVSGIFDSGKA